MSGIIRTSYIWLITRSPIHAEIVTNDTIDAILKDEWDSSKKLTIEGFADFYTNDIIIKDDLPILRIFVQKQDKLITILYRIDGQYTAYTAYSGDSITLTVRDKLILHKILIDNLQDNL